MRVQLWPKSGRVTKRRGATQTQRQHELKFLASQTSDSRSKVLPLSEQCSLTCTTQNAASNTSTAARNPQSAFKKLLSFPVKYLCSRAGAEVHDSAGLHEAVAYYMSGTLPRETRLWQPAGQYPQASQAWS